MAVAVLVPYRAGCEWRERARRWVEARYRHVFPDWRVVYGGCDDGPFNRSDAILTAASATTADMLVIADADAWCEGLPDALQGATEAGWAVPHARVHRLSQQSTERVLGGEEWTPGAMPLSTDNSHDRRPHRASPTGLIVAMRHDVLDAVPPDRRFVGWGQEDEAWRLALETLVGPAWRGTAHAMHLWHPPQPRQSRTSGNTAGVKLKRRYQRAARDPLAMLELIEEGRR